MSGRLFKNIGFLTFSQAANYVLPLVTIPYVTRIVGPENYGLIEFAQSVLLFFIILVNFGFNKTATRKIASSSNDSEIIAKVFWQVSWAKFVLFGIAAIAFVLLLVTVPQLYDNSQILVAGFPIVLGWTLYPSFLFEGQQKLHVNALVEMSIKLSAAALILTLINQPEDFVDVPLYNGAMQMLFGFLALMFAITTLEHKGLQWPRIQIIKGYIAEAQYVFYSAFLTNLTNFGIVVFGIFFFTPIELGIYAAAYKLIYVAISFLFKPLQGALFPFLAQLLAESHAKFIAVFKKSLFALAMIAGIASLFTAFFADELVSLVFGIDYVDSAPILALFAPTIFIGSFLQMFLHQGLLLFHLDKRYMIIVLLGSVLTVLLAFTLVPTFGMKGAVTVKIVVDVLMTILAFLSFKKHFASNPA